MTPRQGKLLAWHLDTAKLTTNDREAVFWVLDLEDRTGMEIAKEIMQQPGRLDDNRDAQRENGNIAALTVVSPLGMANAMLRGGWQTGPLPEGGRYIAIVSDGSITVCGLRSEMPTR